MEEFFKITVICITGAILGLVIKKSAPEIKISLSLLITVLVSYCLLKNTKKMQAIIERLFYIGKIPTELFVPVYKTTLISFVSKIASSICRDAEDTALAAAVEIAAVCCGLTVTIPLIEKLLSILLEFIP